MSGDATAFDADAIPAELRERDQWLMWDASADTPRRPHWRGSFAVSWNDPDDWHSFEEAAEAAGERESWGIGYVFGNTNDDHPRGLYGALDLDGVKTDTDRPKDWLPALQPFFDADAYMERSPSGEGIHIPLAGFEPPEWWSDEHFTDDEHEGVEAYGSKFFTFTGEPLRNSGDEVADTGEFVDAWLTEAYKGITGNDPHESNASDGSADYSGDYTGDGLTPDQAADALDHIDANCGYPRWRDIGFALADEYSDTRALSLFTDWSRGVSKWDDDAPKQAERIIEDSSPGGGRTMATVVRLAQRNGWNHPAGGRSSDPEPTGESGETASADGGTAAAGGGGAAATEDALPEPDYPLVRRNGGYALHHPARDEDSDGWYEQLTNFEIEARTFLRDPDGGDVRADLTVHPGATEPAYDVTLPFTDFNDLRGFKDSVVIGRTTTFDGDTSSLNDLREFVGGQPAPERIGMKRIGLFGDGYEELVTPAGTLGADGWLDEPEHAYVKQGIGIEAKWTLSSERGAKFDPEAVADTLETLPRTRESDRLLPVLGWFYASGFRPLIHEWTGEFNILNVTGGTGAGKSSTLGMLWRLFGMDDDPLSVAEETKFAVTRSLAATNSVPVWFDEYKPATTEQWRIDGFHGLLRTVTRGGAVQRGNADKTTDDYTLSAPTVVSGEQRIQGSAEQRRCIMTTFSPRSTDDGTDTARAYKELTGEGYLEDGEFVGTDAADPQAHALAYYRFVAGLDIEDAERRWKAARVDVSDMLADLDEADAIGAAARQGLQTVVFGLRLYREFAESVGADVTDLVGEDAIESAVRYSAREFVGGGHKSHVDTLIELVAAAARAEYIEEGEHYALVKDGTPNAEIRVNMTAAFDQLTRYVQDFNVQADLLDTYGDYRGRLKEAYENNGSYVVSYRQKTPPIGRAVGIHARRATDALEGFEARAFGCEIIEDREESGGDRMPQAERLTLVPDIIDDLCERDDGAEYARAGDIVNSAMDAGMDKSAVNSTLDKLSKQGDIDQPLTGQYSTQ